MAQLLYGVWDNTIYDNRNVRDPLSPEGFPLDSLAAYNPGNAVLSFIGDRGFLVLSPKAHLAAALWKHHIRLAQESCGRCSPCRSGAPMLRDALALACQGRGAEVDWEAIRTLARHMVKSSMCGVGKTGPVALLAALDHFPELLEKAPAALPAAQDEYTVVTSRCIEACPSHVDVPRYIDCIDDGTDDLAAGVLLRHYPLVGSCGRVCVRFCEQACRRATVDEAVDIKQLKRFAADKLPVAPATLFAGTRGACADKPAVAIVGAGPAGINCAYHLLLRGYPVTIFEASPYAGGMARTGIPPYRLPKETLQDEADIITALGGTYRYGQSLGQEFHIDDLFAQGFKAVFLGIGCSGGQYLNLPGEDTSLHGYINGIDFLRHVHDSLQEGTPPALEGDVVVIGGGNVAMDCCRTAARLTNGTVHVVYRRTEADAPADKEEIAAAREEGVVFHFLAFQDAILAENGKVTGLRCLTMAAGDKDARGRTSVTPVPDSQWDLPCSHIIAAIGQYIPDGVFTSADGISCDKRGRIVVDASLQTSRAGVFSGGDCATGPKTFIAAMAQGEQAACAIHDYLTKGAPGFVPRQRMSEILQAGKLMDDGKPATPVRLRPRTPLRTISPAERDHSFAEVDLCMSQQDARKEARRCMRCYRLFTVVTESPIPGKED